MRYNMRIYNITCGMYRVQMRKTNDGRKIWRKVLSHAVAGVAHMRLNALQGPRMVATCLLSDE